MNETTLNGVCYFFNAHHYVLSIVAMIAGPIAIYVIGTGGLALKYIRDQEADEEIDRINQEIKEISTYL